MNADDAAFPIVQNGTIGAPGLTIRQYAAIQAMQGYCANPRISDDMSKACKSDTALFHQGLAVLATSSADALLAELAKTKTNP